MRMTFRGCRVAAALFTIVSLPTHAVDAGSVAAPVTAVTLYPGSAAVARTVRVTPGMTRFTVSGLPARFDPQSLRAEGGAGIRIGEVVMLEAARSDAVNPEEARLEDRIRTLRDERAALDGEMTSAEIVKAYLERLDGGPSGSDRVRMPTDAKTLAGVVETLGRSAAEVMARMQKIAQRQREADRRIEAAERDLARMRTGVRDTRSLTVNLSAERAGEVRLTYQVANAGWKPSYRASLDSAASTVLLERMATVSQKTGEDWTNVRLVLSTSQPRPAQRAPDPQPWLIGRQMPMARQASLSAPVAAAPAMEMKSLAKPEQDDAWRAPTFESQGMYATEYELPARASLPSDGREMSLPLARLPLPARQYLLVAPRSGRTATVMVEAERPEGAWPAGPLQLMRDGAHVGSTAWNPQAAERFEFPFGSDDLVRVTVDVLKGDTGSGGLFGKRAERRIAHQYTIANAHRTPVDVLVLDAAPVGTDEEIRVKAGFDPKPNIEDWKQRRGVVGWERRIAPGDKLKITVDHAIDYPADWAITGLR